MPASRIGREFGNIAMNTTGSEPPQVELSCFGIRVTAKGTLSVVIVSLLTAAGITLYALLKGGA
jgi:hypothetical protein